MSWSKQTWRSALTVRSGFQTYFADNPPAILLTTTVPRALLQCTFFTLLGRVVGGEGGARFAFIGSIAMTMTLSSIVGICDVPMLEKWSGTFYRLQLGELRPGTTFVLRSLPWISEAAIDAIACIVVVGPVTGLVGVSVAVLPAIPVYLLMAVTSAAAGLAAASFAVGRRTDVLVGNAFSYLVLVAAGVLVPAGRLSWLDTVGSVLPLRNGLVAVRAIVDGGAWGGAVLAEVGVGIGWAVLGWAAYRAQSRRAIRLGTDDFE